MERQQRHKLLHPFNEDHLKHGSYEMTLSREVLATSTTDTSPVGDPRSGNRKVFAIPPGQFALLYTEEWLKNPADVLAFISIKASIKLAGLVNISGFHVDPGFEGKLKFSVYNAGSKPIFLEFGKPTFLIWFSSMDDETDSYQGNHKNQNRISAQDRQQLSGSGHSPESLNIRTGKLELHAKIILWVLASVIVPLLIGIGFAITNFYLNTYVKVQIDSKMQKTKQPDISNTLPQPGN